MAKNIFGGGITLRRRMMMGQEEDEKMKEWQTIVDMVTEEEIFGGEGAFEFTTMPDGTPIEGKGFREIAAYVDCKANSEGGTSAYIRLTAEDINGTRTGAQPTAGVPSSGYRRLYFHIMLGCIINLNAAWSSSTTSMSPITIYDVNGTSVLDEIKKIDLVSYAKIGAGTIIKIMGR